MAQYLDKTGLTTLWNKIKNTFALKSHTHSKSEVGLGNVDNTSDADKPVSNATQQALNLKANASDVYTKSETDNKINKPLYNLGAYDTISGNSDGTYTITRQTGYVDLGTLNWSVQQTSANYRFVAPLYQLVYGTSNVLCSKYSYVGGDATWNGVLGISTDANASIIQICDTSYADATAFKNAIILKRCEAH